MLHKTSQNFQEVWVLNDFIQQDFDLVGNGPSKNPGFADKNILPFSPTGTRLSSHFHGKSKIALNYIDKIQSSQPNDASQDSQRRMEPTTPPAKEGTNGLSYARIWHG